jgi:hypothetical protein
VFVKQKLAYEWKNIYRTLTQIDINSNGIVPFTEFQNAVAKNGVYLTREDFKNISSMFGEDG